ncbi:MAG: lipoate--protein ligase [Flexilinea sp.]
MLYIPNENLDPTRNLAMEEYILSGMSLNDDVLFFFIDEPSIIVGRHQNTSEEINETYVKEHGIHVVRRLSGGGAVYHDLGNLCFSFIIPDNKRQTPDFQTFTAPVVQALNKLGAPVELSGRNDLLLNGAKISGNAYYHNAFGSVCHGTLLFDSDLSILSQALQVNPEKINSKGIKSVRSRVVNLKSSLPEISDVRALRQALIHEIPGTQGLIQIREFSRADLEAIEQIANARYRTWDWNYGKSPAYNIRCQKRFDFGNLDAQLQVEEGIIRAIHLFGDFFTVEDPEIIEHSLNGIKYQSDTLSEALNLSEIEKIFPGINTGEFIKFLLKED